MHFRLFEDVKEKARYANEPQKDIDGIIEHLENFNDVWARTVEVAIGTWLLQRQVGATCMVPLILTLGKQQAFHRKECIAFVLTFRTSMFGWSEAGREDNRKESTRLEPRNPEEDSEYILRAGFYQSY